MTALPGLLARRLPFYYGWVILFCACCAGFSRQGGAVATLSIFVEPMTRDFGWSRAMMSGAVSAGGVLAALLAPTLGRLLDRSGAKLVLCLAVLATGLANLLLSLTASLAMFYLLFCIARTNFAGPFDLGIYGAVNNWFVARRYFATGVATLAVEVLGDPGVAADAAEVTITLKNGASHTCRIDHCIGSASNPMSDEQLTCKFVALSEPVLGAATAKELLDRSWAVECMDNVGDLGAPHGVTRLLADCAPLP